MEVLAARPIPAESYWAMLSVPIVVYIVSVLVNQIPFRVDLAASWDSRWRTPKDVLGEEHSGLRMGWEFGGHAAVVVGLVVLVSQANVVDLPDAVRIAVWPWLIVLVVLIAYVLAARMPVGLALFHAAVWFVKIAAIAVVVSGLILYPDAWGVYDME